MKLLTTLFALLVTYNGNNVQAKEKLLFGMASGGSNFYDAIKQGWEDACAAHSDEVDCEYFAENKTSFPLTHPELVGQGKPCLGQIRDMIDRGFDGISLYCGEDHAIVKEAKDKGIALTSFDIIPPNIPMPFIGTDNFYLGVTMARLLRQLKPEGGTYHVVSFRKKAISYQGFVQEIERDNHRDDRAHWHKVTTNISGRPEGDDLVNGESLGTSLNDENENPTSYNRTMEKLLDLKPDAVVFMYTRPLRFQNYTRWRAQLRPYGTAVIGTQASDRELQLMTRKQVDGLVGQLTYDMGAYSFNTLYNIKKQKVPIPDDAKIYTQVINYNLVPEALPAVNVDQSLIGNLKYVGFLCFALIALLVMFCLGWTLYNRNGMVVRASQPLFLIMTASGVLVMASAIIPLSFDDNGEGYNHDSTRAVAICMSIPWLAFLGFTSVFSALFAKTWRVNKFFQSKQSFERIQVQAKDVLAPFAILLSSNILVLTLWTILDPLTYIREFEAGTDLYNREIASNGRCRSDNVAAYLVPLSLLNFIAIVLCCWQAAHARNIKSEFAEANYIGLTVFSLAQAFVTGIPIVAVVKDIPEAYYLVLTFVIFILSMVILLLIFLPKVFMQRRYSSMSLAEQRKSLAVSIRSSTRNTSNNWNTSGGSRDDYSRQFHQPVPNDASDPSGGDVGPKEPYQLGSVVERIDDSEVRLDKRSTYATEELDGTEKKYDATSTTKMDASGNGAVSGSGSQDEVNAVLGPSSSQDEVIEFESSKDAASPDLEECTLQNETYQLGSIVDHVDESVVRLDKNKTSSKVAGATEELDAPPKRDYVATSNTKTDASNNNGMSTGSVSRLEVMSAEASTKEPAVYEE